MREAMRVVCLSVLALLGPVLAQAATIHVSKSGSVGNSCATARAPACTGGSCARLTLAGGISCLVGGDTLMLHAGTYTNEPIRGMPGGTVSARTTLRAAGDGAVLIRSTDQGLDCLFCVGANFLTVDGAGSLTIDGGAASIFVVSGTLRNDITVRNTRITNSRGQGFFVDQGERWVVNNNEIDHHGPPGNNFRHGMYFSANNSTISNNYLHHNACYNLQNYSSTNHAPMNNTIKGNIFTASGCAVTSPMGSGHRFLNNIFYNDGLNMGGAAVGLLYAASNGKIYNNTFYCNKLLYNNGGSPATGTIVRGNIFYCPGKTLTVTLPGSVTIANNLMNTNPNFINAGAGNFHLNAGSPAINASVTLTEASPDKDGVARPQPSGGAYDYGAYEFVSGGGGGGPPAGPPALLPAPLRLLGTFGEHIFDNMGLQALLKVNIRLATTDYLSNGYDGL